MARLRSSQNLGISLFPMFNILTCLLGSLIFIIGAITAISLGVGRSIIITPIQIESTNKKPVYLEWDGKHLIVYPKKQIINLSIDIKKYGTFKDLFIDLDKQIQGTPFEKLLRRLNKKEKYFVVLIRPSGFDNFILLRNYILDFKKIDIGYEPVEENVRLRIR